MTEALRKVSAGILPALEISPSNPWMQWMLSTLSRFLPRERFTNFRGLLEDHIGFNEIESLVKPDSPVLLIGAANVKKGNLKIFSSKNGEFSMEAILASACIPNLFPAVQIGDDYYWDGLFSANPPVDELIQFRFMVGEYTRRNLGHPHQSHHVQNRTDTAQRDRGPAQSNDRQCLRAAGSGNPCDI